jgi:hypothetical protein
LGLRALKLLRVLEKHPDAQERLIHTAANIILPRM